MTSHPSARIVIMGNSGSGKTTFASRHARLDDAVVHTDFTAARLLCADRNQ